MSKTTKVLIVDDSALVRKVMRELIASDSRFEVVGQVANPVIAFEKLKELKPDVISLDLEMPEMDGLTFLEKLMTTFPLPVVICSSVAEKQSDNAIRALQLGAVDIIPKPQIGIKNFLEESKLRITDALYAAGQCKNKLRIKPPIYSPSKTVKQQTMCKNIPANKVLTTTNKVIAVGASTGGTEAIRVFLSNLNITSPGVVIVQHMPEKFTFAFANRMNDLFELDVREARSGDVITNGVALIAPGNQHMIVHRTGATYRVNVMDGPLVSRHRPSVDVLFRSVAKNVGANAIGCILTGMGSDGAAGLKEMHDVGAYTLGQDENSCIVFGMPSAAHKVGAVDKLLAKEEMGNEIHSFLNRRPLRKK